MPSRRPDWILLGIVVLAALLAGCDGRGNGIPAGRGQTGWGVADFPRAQEDEDTAHDPVAARPQRDGDGAEQEAAPAPHVGRRERKRGWGFDESRPSDTLPSQTEQWDTDREKPSDSMPSQTERWGKDREMPSDNMPSRSFPKFSREPLPSESKDTFEPDE